VWRKELSKKLHVGSAARCVIGTQGLNQTFACLVGGRRQGFQKRECKRGRKLGWQEVGGERGPNAPQPYSITEILELFALFVDNERRR
jgi:hypothetical protein